MNPPEDLFLFGGVDPDVASLTGEFGSLSGYRGDGAASSGSDDGSADSFENNASVIAEDAVDPQQNENDAASTSTQSSRTGLPLAVQKELVLAIEGRGGIDRVKTATLLKQLPQYKATQFLKTQVGNKISRWKGIHRNKYEALKLSFSQELRAQQQQQQPNPIRSSNSNTRVRQSPARPPLVPPSSGLVPPFSPHRRSSPALSFSAQSPSPSPSFASPQLAVTPPVIRPFAPLPAGMNSTLHAMAARARAIPIDHDFPEQNSPFVVHLFENHELPSGRVASGYIIELLDQDPRHLMTNFTGTEIPSFEAFTIAEHEVLIKKPSVSFTYLRDEAAEHKGLTAAGILDKPFTQPIGVARNAIIRDSDRQFQTFRLTFPFPLNNDVLFPNAENGAIKPKVIPVISSYDVAGASGDVQINSHRVNIQWWIAKNENVLRSTKQSKKTNELDTQVKGIFGNLDRMGMLSLNPVLTGSLHPSTSAALVVSSGAAVTGTSATNTKHSVGASATKRSVAATADDNVKDGKRAAIAAAPAAVPLTVAFHPITKRALTEEEAELLVEEFARTNHCSHSDAINKLKAAGANDWQSAVNLLIVDPSKVRAASASQPTATPTAGPPRMSKGKGEAEYEGSFKSTVDPQAARDSLEELQKKET